MIGDESLRNRLRFFKIDDDSVQALHRITPVMKQALAPALDAFYMQVKAFPEIARFFSSDDHIKGAKSKQITHWSEILTGRFNDEYVQRARAIGQVHARIGLEPQWYIGGYSLIIEQLVRALVAEHESKKTIFSGLKKPTDDLASNIGALVKAAMLDMDIVLSTYLEEAENERVKSESIRQEAEEKRKEVVADLATGLDRLANGDLLYRLDQNVVPAEYTQIYSDFNGAMQKLQDAMELVIRSSMAIRADAHGIEASTSDLSKRTEQQAASLEETAAALDQITATVRKTAEGADQAHKMVRTAKNDAEQSGHVVRNAIGAMNQIEKSSQQISQIIGVIDEIAFQTNLLALNAGVEAARAGDAGKGFAVVASEVRALAQRSADAAKEIKELISASGKQVETGVSIVGETRKMLEQIVLHVSEIDTVVSEITAAAQEQSAGLNQVNTAVNRIDQVTQKNITMVEETTLAGHKLSQETEELTRLISRFQVGNQIAPPVLRPIRSVAKAAPIRGMVRPKPGKAANAPSKDDWEEF